MESSLGAIASSAGTFHHIGFVVASIQASVQAELPGELVAGYGENILLIRGVHCPQDDRIDKFGAPHPAFEENHDSMRKDIVTGVHGVRDSEMVGKGLVGWKLIYIPG